MKCGMCGFEFDPEEAETSCGGCPLVRGCGLVRCPRCGYEMPPEAALVRWVRRIRFLLTHPPFICSLRSQTFGPPSNAKRQHQTFGPPWKGG